MANLLHDLLHDRHRVSRDLLAALRPEDFAQIRRVATERGSQNRARAIDLLVDAHDSEAYSLLSGILREDPDRLLRGLAARQLGRLGHPESERTLVQALAEEGESSVQIQIAGALARIGNKDSLAQLNQLAEAAPEGPLREEAVFARAVVASRAGVTGYELAPPHQQDVLLLDSELARPFMFDKAPLREALLARQGVGSENWGLDLAVEQSYLLDCGPTRMVLFLDFDALTLRGGVSGLLTERSQEDGSYHPLWVVMCWPAFKGSKRFVAVHRPSGRRVLGGVLSTQTGGFELHSVKATGNEPLFLRGTVEGLQIKVADALTGGRKALRRVPTPMEPPGGGMEPRKALK